MTSFSSQMCFTPCEQITKNCCKFLSVNCWYWVLNDFFKFFFCVYYLLTSICYFEYLCDSISNHIWKIGSGMFSSLLIASRNQLQYCTLSTQSTSWRFCTAVMCMVSSEAILWLHVHINFDTQSRIISLNFFNLWFIIMFHTTCFCRLYKNFLCCYVIGLLYADTIRYWFYMRLIATNLIYLKSSKIRVCNLSRKTNTLFFKYNLVIPISHVPVA